MFQNPRSANFVRRAFVEHEFEPLMERLHKDYKLLDENEQDALVTKRVSNPMIDMTGSKSSRKKKKHLPQKDNDGFVYLCLPINSENTGPDLRAIQMYLNFLARMCQPRDRPYRPIYPLGHIVKAIYGSQANYVVEACVESPCQTTVQDFFNLALKNFPKISYEDICEYYQISAKQASRQTLDKFLHCGVHSRPNVTKYAEVGIKSGVNYDRRNPVYILRPMLGWRSFNLHALVSHQLKMKENNKTKPRAKSRSKSGATSLANSHKTMSVVCEGDNEIRLGNNLKKPNFVLLSCHHIKPHLYQKNALFHWMGLSHVFKRFHWNFRAQRFWKRISLPAPTDVHFQDALSKTGFDYTFNYETLETLGDSVLKLVVTGYLYLRFAGSSESMLTNIR